VPTYCSPIAWAEVFAGLRPGEEPATQAFFEARGELALDARAGRLAGAYLARYALSHGVEIADALVASAAVLGGLSLWTRNRKHYPMPEVSFYSPSGA
jgi:predicted nucleic acid-binding protein